jgi:hypothetical protein
VAFLRVIVALFVSSVSAAQAPAERMLSGARCEPVIRARLAEWQADLGAALSDPAGPTGMRSVRVPTGAIGLWLRVAEMSQGEVAIERITATRIERLRFDDECVATEFVVDAPVPEPGAFTDSDLIARVARGGRGVFLLWSPHMPLSVDQHAVLTAVAQELGLEVVLLLDPTADGNYAARVAGERGLPPGATRPLGGIELAMRGITTHTPSLQVFAAGRLVGPVLYGYRGSAALRDALERVIAGRSPG